MSTQVQRRWGIVALGILMLLATMIVTGISGRKTAPLYYFAWMMVSYYGYKGNLVPIRGLMKWLIIINLVVLVICLIFLDEYTITYLSTDKSSLLFGVLLMLIPKAILYFYVDDEIKKDTSSMISNVVKADKPKVQPSNPYKIPSMEDAYTITQPISQAISKTTQPKMDKQREVAVPVNEDELWEVAIVEFDGESRKKGLWAKCFAEADGNENLAKANYLKLRVAELKSQSETIVETQQPNSSQVVESNPNDLKPKTISCPMCHTTNLRARDKCASCGYDLKGLTRVFGE